MVIYSKCKHSRTWPSTTTLGSWNQFKYMETSLKLPESQKQALLNSESEVLFSLTNVSTFLPSRGTAQAQSSHRRCSPCRSCRRSSRNAGLWGRPPSWLKSAPTHTQKAKCKCFYNATCECGSSASTTTRVISLPQVMLCYGHKCTFCRLKHLTKHVPTVPVSSEQGFGQLDVWLMVRWD